MEKSQIALREERLRKIEDIKNTCESLVEKIGQLQVDLFNDPDKDLEKNLDKLNNELSGSHRTIVDDLFHPYENKLTELKNQE